MTTEEMLLKHPEFKQSAIDFCGEGEAGKQTIYLNGAKDMLETINVQYIGRFVRQNPNCKDCAHLNIYLTECGECTDHDKFEKKGEMQNKKNEIRH